ncbi:MAG: prepilin-type N-terminal cleavage/methylation domain-containing protein [Synechocystis sp.]|nr:prepilin-type N-terminal cleavage/methylation domain-containing protein [Synechocystis sp.]
MTPIKLSTVYKLFSLPYDPRCADKNHRGMTLIELIVGVIIGGILIQLAYFAFSVNRQLYLTDVAKNEANQNLKTVFDVVGPLITQAGEGVGTDPKFPIISIRPYPTGSTNSEIIVRLLKFSTKLRLCEPVAAGTPTEITVFDSSMGAPLGCDPVDNNNDNYPDDLTGWKRYREVNGRRVRIFIYNGDGVGEWLTYTGERVYDAGGTEITTAPTPGQVVKSTIRVNGTLVNSYPAGGATQLLILEEQGYRLDTTTNILQSIVGANVVNLINNVGQFTVTATVRQGITPSNCTTLLPQSDSFTCTPGLTETYNWSQIDGVNVTTRPEISADTPGLSTPVITQINSATQTQTFYPRNLLNF